MKNLKSHPILDQFENSMNNQLLKHAASKHIFCPNCDRILDWTTIVLIDVFTDKGTVYRGPITCCTSCFKPAGLAKLEAKGMTLEVNQYKG